MCEGKTGFLPQQERRQAFAIVDALRYAGYQIAYLLGGWIILTVVICLVLLFITFSIVLPCLKIYPDWFWGPWFLKSFLWVILVPIGFYLAQVLVVGFFFQVRRPRQQPASQPADPVGWGGSPDAARPNGALLRVGAQPPLPDCEPTPLSQRGFLCVCATSSWRVHARWACPWSTALWFWWACSFFINIFIGLYSFILRLVLNVVLGMLWISRLDKNMMTRGYE